MPSPTILPLSVRPGGRSVGTYDVFELTFDHDRTYDNPFFDVGIDCTFTSPSGKAVNIGGFHYGSDEQPTVEQGTFTDRKGVTRPRRIYRYTRQNLWKVRFAPAETGQWKYTWSFRNNAGAQMSGEGTFTCTKSDAHGFVRQDPNNPFQWIHDDGTPYFPFGQQQGVADARGDGSLLKARHIDGPFRIRDEQWKKREEAKKNDRKAIPAAPLLDGPEYAQAQVHEITAEEYHRVYAEAGFNLWRFSNWTGGNQAILDDLDHILVHENRMLDEFFALLRKYNSRIFFTMFGDYKDMFKIAPGEPEITKAKRFIQYCVNRWGAIVDFWELMNEQYPDDRWNSLMASYLKEIDPYKHPISTSYEKPELPEIDINSPHWYSEDSVETESDIMTVEHAKEWRRFGKPIMLGEQGNNKGRQRNRDYPRPGDGGCWDIRSHVRARIRVWTAFIHEVSFIYWNTTSHKDAYHSNIYLGPQERQYHKVLARVAEALGGGVVATRPLADRQVSVKQFEEVRGYQIFTASRAMVYLHHMANHTTTVNDVEIKIVVPKAGKAYWIFPETGAILASSDVEAGKQTLTAPPFTIDMALLITDGPAPVMA